MQCRKVLSSKRIFDPTYLLNESEFKLRAAEKRLSIFYFYKHPTVNVLALHREMFMTYALVKEHVEDYLKYLYITKNIEELLRFYMEQ